MRQVANPDGRTIIEKIKEWRGLAPTRNDKPPTSFAGLHLRGAIIWLRSLH
jgi:hypothetical protein